VYAYAVKLNHCLSADHLVLQVGEGEQPGRAPRAECETRALCLVCDCLCCQRQVHEESNVNRIKTVARWFVYLCVASREIKKNRVVTVGLDTPTRLPSPECKLQN